MNNKLLEEITKQLERFARAGFGKTIIELLIDNC